jgi:hypothetical protein
MSRSNVEVLKKRTIKLGQTQRQAKSVYSLANLINEILCIEISNESSAHIN